MGIPALRWAGSCVSNSGMSYENEQPEPLLTPPPGISLSAFFELFPEPDPERDADDEAVDVRRSSTGG